MFTHHIWIRSLVSVYYPNPLFLCAVFCFQSVPFPPAAPGLSVSGSSGGVPDMGGTIYSKTQVSQVFKWRCMASAQHKQNMKYLVL